MSPELQAVFDQGIQVGEEARKRFPGGRLVDFPAWDFFSALKTTREYMAGGEELLYEAAFEYKGCYARVDILQFSKESQRWSLYEVKSATKLKDEHIEDIGLQAWIVANSGIPLEKISLLCLNSGAVHPNLENLFEEHDLTERIREKYPGIAPTLTQIFKEIRRPEVPFQELGPQCFDPRPCEFKEYCFSQNKIPSPSLFDFPQFKKDSWELYRKGIVEITDSRLQPEDPFQSRIVECHRENRRYINARGIADCLRDWQFPLFFLDFETLNPALPRYRGCSPYSQVPFQYSVHVLKSWEEEPVHYEYLAKSSEDPREELIPRLLDVCESKGSLVAYYARFEKDRIQEMADVFSEFQSRLRALLERFRDPLEILRLYVYDPAFQGSFSLKSVAPALLGKASSYEHLSVRDGLAAQRTFTEMIEMENDDEKRQSLYFSLLEYCRKDTQVMVDLVRWLFQQARRD